jgi:branched-chain amino acid transport system substrate-binding protein
MSGEQARWGYENLNAGPEEAGRAGLRRRDAPDQHLCADHMGSNWARVHTWDGKKWNFSSDWLQADEQILKPLVKSTAAKYAADKKLTPRTPADCQS